MNNIFDAMRELDEALKIRRPKKVNPNETRAESLGVTVDTFTLLDEDVVSGKGYLFIDFFYIDGEGDFKESEALLKVNELEDDILKMKVNSFYSLDDGIVLRVDIIKYINSVLKNPNVPVIHKSMLTVYKEQIMNGEVF